MSKNESNYMKNRSQDGRVKYRMPYIDLLTNKHKTVSDMDKATSSNYKIAKRYLEDRILRNNGSKELQIPLRTALFRFIWTIRAYP